MLKTIATLTPLGIGIFYPLSFLIHAKTPLKGGFHRFHLGMPLVVGGIVSVFLLADKINPLTKGLLLTWWLTLALFAFYYWKKESSPSYAVAVPSLFGLFAFLGVQSKFFHHPSPEVGVTNVLSGIILCAALHSMMLGHHYLNVRGLSLDYLKRANKVLWTLLGLRLLWDLYFLLNGKMTYNGDEISILHFSLRLDGFLLWIGIFFGTLFPFITLFFVKEILKFRNTQSATGILYVLLCSIFMGHLAYSYYVLKFGIAL